MPARIAIGRAAGLRIVSASNESARRGCNTNLQRFDEYAVVRIGGRNRYLADPL